MHEDVKRYADSNDVKGLRYIFVDCLDVDPTFEKYAEDFAYCKNLDGLFEAHVELTPMITNQQQWNDAYWVQLKTDLMKNFSMTRFEHMRRVAKVIYAEKIVRITAEREQQRQREEKAAEENQPILAKGQKQNEPLEEKYTEHAPMSKSEEQAKRLEERRRQLEQEKQRFLAEERKEKERREKRRTGSAEVTASSMESSDLKKVLGVALVVVVILIIILIVVGM